MTITATGGDRRITVDAVTRVISITPAATGGGGGVTDHGALTGLTDDDHSQYALADGSRGSFATTAQGSLADTATQPADLGTAAPLDVGTTAGTVAAGDDARLSNARTPTAHATAHADGGTDEVSLDASQVTSGRFAVARLASGIPDGTKFVRDDGTLAVPKGGRGWLRTPTLLPSGQTFQPCESNIGTTMATGAIGYTALIPHHFGQAIDRISLEFTAVTTPGDIRFAVYVPDGADVFGAQTRVEVSPAITVSSASIVTWTVSIGAIGDAWIGVENVSLAGTYSAANWHRGWAGTNPTFLSCVSNVPGATLPSIPIAFSNAFRPRFILRAA